MGEIEMALLAMDKNTPNTRNYANQAKSVHSNRRNVNHKKVNANDGNTSARTNNNNSNSVRKYKGNYDKSQVECYHCGEPGHYKYECPKLINKQKNEKAALSNGNKSREITLSSNNSEDVKVNMAVHGNAGRKPKWQMTDEPVKNDLYNWVMDSGCTCHMTPFRSDFLPNSESTIDRVVEVADGFTVPAKISGTILLHVLNDNGENIHLKLENVLHVPDLARRLFSLMSLIEQDHHVMLSKQHGVQILFHGETSKITLPMPNYHLFASASSDKNPELTPTTDVKKKKVDLDLLYKRMGCRSIKTLLSSNQAGIWKDVEINVGFDVISTSDHHIATIRKRRRKLNTEPNPDLKPGSVFCVDIEKSPSKISITPESTYPYYLFLVDKYSRRPFIQGVTSVSAASIISAIKYVLSQYFNQEKNSELTIMKRCQSDYGSVFTSTEFEEFCKNESFKHTMASPKHLEMNSILERTWQSLCLLKNSFLVQARVDESYTHFALLYACEIFSIIPIRTLRKNGKLTTSTELFTGTKPSINKFRVLFCPCVFKKYTVSIKNEHGKLINKNVS